MKTPNTEDNGYNRCTICDTTESNSWYIDGVDCYCKECHTSIQEQKEDYDLIDCDFDKGTI